MIRRFRYLFLAIIALVSLYMLISRQWDAWHWVVVYLLAMMASTLLDIDKRLND